MSELESLVENTELDRSIMGFDFSVRTRRALTRLNVYSLRDLLEIRADDLMSQRNFGKTSLDEVKKELKRYGLKLKKEKASNRYSDKIKELAEQGLDRQEIAKELRISYGYLCQLISGKDLHVEGAAASIKKITSEVALRINDFIGEGKGLPEISEEISVTREGIRMYINRTGQYEKWRAAREARKSGEILAMEQKKTLIEGIVGGLLKYKYEKETEFGKKKALEYFIATNFRTNYSFETLERVFMIYETAEKKGKKLSLEKIAEKSKTGIMSPAVGRILERVGPEPMNGSNERRGKFSETELKAIKRAGRIKICKPDLAYFMGFRTHNLTSNFSRLKVKRSETNKFVKSFGVGIYHTVLSYRLASQIYEAQDAGYFKDFSREEMADFFETKPEVVKYALKHKREIAPKIIKTLKTIYDRKSNKPYRIESDSL